MPTKENQDQLLDLATKEERDARGVELQEKTETALSLTRSQDRLREGVQITKQLDRLERARRIHKDPDPGRPERGVKARVAKEIFGIRGAT